MKRVLLVVGTTIVIFGLLFYGCCFFLFGGINQPYEFRQDYDQIVKIEILSHQGTAYDSASVEVLKVLDITEHRAFIDDLIKVEGSRNGLTSTTSFGRHIIRITYQNGEIELIGPYNNGYIPVGGRLHVDCYGMNKDQFYNLLSEVLGQKITEPTLG